MPAPSVLALADEPFVALTTFRRSGDGVRTPVWVARDGDTLVVTTVDGSGKVKRLRRDPRVVLEPCDRRGEVAPGAPRVEGRGEVVDDRPAQECPRRAIAAKYGWQYRVISLVGRVGALLGRPRRPQVILRLRD
ncbi:PPOX class F420-dependent oxidoreductase [Actinomycetospora cinnamomea]|uniref:Pyridoxamine 5'-phosphate oxidase N-terminal domain-containing protein n=1 Tax=Actinomycetospora cinnamomea TaxID=663609 RepID=A0A2U1FFI2_9PSEU|nr:PPOX class F420-dependent oxidoreductase [Actinomycetospora cinnamomea]PVZ10917.1 hypothetical protein C8D89_104130 [Actinomycetospora cinnamomea]